MMMIVHTYLNVMVRKKSKGNYQVLNYFFFPAQFMIDIFTEVHNAYPNTIAAYTAERPSWVSIRIREYEKFNM